MKEIYLSILSFAAWNYAQIYLRHSDFSSLFRTLYLWETVIPYYLTCHRCKIYISRRPRVQNSVEKSLWWRWSLKLCSNISPSQWFFIVISNPTKFMVLIIKYVKLLFPAKTYHKLLRYCYLFRQLMLKTELHIYKLQIVWFVDLLRLKSLQFLQ